MPVLDNVSAVEDAQDGVGVSDVNRQQHVAPAR
jgi:hypothetical protein